MSISVFAVNWQKEIEDLRSNLANISSASGDGAQKLKEDYLQKLTLLEAQASLELIPCILIKNVLTFVLLFIGF